ncbi:hypothetical protein H1R20_g11989, partial [Candolleomyces eurysporus]
MPTIITTKPICTIFMSMAMNPTSSRTPKTTSFPDHLLPTLYLHLYDQETPLHILVLLG